MKWLKPHTTPGEFKIVKRFAILPIHTDDGYMVWLEPVWVLKEYNFDIGVFYSRYTWEPVFKGSSYSACVEEIERKKLREARARLDFLDSEETQVHS